VAADDVEESRNLEIEPDAGTPDRSAFADRRNA
jgi:hypothetical protein